ncbi:hypothetical protein [Pseudomonas sp.]|uniref:hypothetical protein n=1 Tax=Pseudomonas sp. TaxID=306 RepID=UPI0028A9D606|nr:hypothetical protein [Pseudomonas sp.]
MLKLNPSQQRNWPGRRVAGNGVASWSQTRTMRPVWRYRRFARQAPVLKVIFTPLVHFSAARIRQYFAVIQQMDALKAQEKTRFEEIHRDT